MTIRNITADMAAPAVAQVDGILDATRREHGVHSQLAIESGNRAWDFPSPGRDYDGASSMCGPRGSPWPSGRAAM